MRYTLRGLTGFVYNTAVVRRGALENEKVELGFILFSLVVGSVALYNGYKARLSHTSTLHQVLFIPFPILIGTIKKIVYTVERELILPFS